MKTINTYTFKELSPEAKEKALEKWRASNSEDFWLHGEEIVDSLKGLIKVCRGVEIKDWKLGAYSLCTLEVEFNNPETEDLSGKRALAWLENNLLTYLRIPFVGEKRWSVSKYGEDYRSGKIMPCPFTGLYADDDFLDALIKSVKEGNSLKDSFKSLADTAGKLLDQEADSINGEDYFEEYAESNDLYFLENGRRI